jgi:hypothetical protein
LVSTCNPRHYTWGKVFFVDSYQQGDGEDGIDEVFSKAFSRFERWGGAG